MANSSRALIKYNQSPNDPNLQWQPVQLIGERKVNKWGQTIGELVSTQVPIQWTGTLATIAASELPIWAELEQPITHYILAQKGRTNPNVYDAISVRLSQPDIIATYNKFVRTYPSNIYIVLTSDRNIWDYADFPNRGN